ncbi:MAG: DUF3108 domain-containing protein [Bacteroidales bacterium]|jgi:hypothetical protein|nr:DUF3108 domain-containing protein [Bacteroidales bacterium]
MKNTIFSIFLLFTTLNAFTQSEKFPFKSGEKITYSAHYHWGLFWMEAGEVIFQIDTVHKNDEIVLKMQSLGRTLPKYDWLFKVRDTFASDAIYPEMKPLTFKRANYEGKDWVRNYYVFNHEVESLILDMESNNSKRRLDTISLPKGHIMDVQTAVYYARLWNLIDAKSGDQKIMKIMLAGEYFTIPMTYRGKETVKHINGNYYSCFKITTKVVEGLIFRANQEISIYVSDEEHQLPLVVKAPILIGRVEAYLRQTSDVEFPESLPD